MPRILVVDDTEELLHLIERYLTEKGFSVLTSTTAEGALKILRREKIDLVLTDIILPDREGIDLITEISKVYPKVKTVVMTGGGAVGSSTYLETARLMGVDGTLEKPFALGALVRLMDKILL
jgi:DNA-binding NtrC family response regulator